MKPIFQTRTLKSLVAAGTLAATALSPLAAAPAAADGWHRGDVCYQYNGRQKCGPRGDWRSYHRHDDRDGLAAAIIGLAGVAIVAGALSQANRAPAPEYYAAPDVYPPVPGASAPHVVTYESSLEPWTTGWYKWCDARYDTFNPQTGTFHGYDGRDHFCVPK